MQTKGFEESSASQGDSCALAQRNRFFRGKRMSAEEFAMEQAYAIGRRRSINRSVLGWGVVAGLELSAVSQGKPLRVGKGLALDAYGREIELRQAVELEAGNIGLLTADGCRTQALSKIAPGRYVLSIHYAERRFGDANLRDGCGCDRPEKNFICETTFFTLRPYDEKCGCPCVECNCARSCDCTGGACCAGGRGPHACLCQWLARTELEQAEPALCKWQGLDVALNGVALACVTVARNEAACTPFEISSVDDACGPRRLVKNLDLLFDLLRGCDLLHISSVSWAKWHRQRQVEWCDFADMFHANGEVNGETEFVVKFSGPVRNETVGWDVLAMTVFTIDPATGWRRVRRVPVIDLDLTPDPSAGPLPAGTTNQFRVKVHPNWVRDELQRGRESLLTERGFTVEIEVRGDLILDCRGQAIDANARGKDAAPTGNGTPGGTFFSSFRVKPKPADKSRAAVET